MKKIITFVALIALTATATAQNEFTQGNEKYSNTLHTQYINLPILARLKIGNLGILAGVQGGILVNKPSLENTFNGRTVKLDRSDFAKFDFGAVVGAEFNVTDHFLIDIRFNQGLVNALNSSNSSVRNLNISSNNNFLNVSYTLGVGYRF